MPCMEKDNTAVIPLAEGLSPSALGWKALLGQYSHAPFQLWSHFLIHLDQAATVVDKHAIQIPVFDVDPKNKI